MFLNDYAEFTQASFSTDNKDEKKKPGMFGTVKNVVVGKTIPGMLTRAAAIGTVGAGLYGRNKVNNIKVNNDKFGYRSQYRKKRLMKNIGDIGKTALGTTAGVAAGGGALMAARNEYDKRNRKWWEVL